MQSTQARLCTIDGCGKAHEARGLCDMHYQRVRRGLDPRGRQCVSCDRYLAEAFGERYGKRRFCSDACKPRCSFSLCERPLRKGGLCEAHYEQSKRTGSTWGIRPWGDVGGACEFCDSPIPANVRSRRFCSGACARLWYRWRGDRPAERPCAECGMTIDLNFMHPSGKRRPATARLCERCRARHRFGMSVNQLAARDGAVCAICREAVDMTLRRPDSLFGPSIDHVVPRANGGTDDPDNLALAHFWCNAVKSDREGFTI